MQSPHPQLKYPRVLLKISGEALCAQEGGSGLDPASVGAVADELKKVYELGVQLALVCGGGNIFRGLKGAANGMDRTTADHMGMLATVMNALALQDAIEKRGVPTRIQTAIEMNRIAEQYIRRRAVRHLEKGRIVLFAAGTGNPYFSTDTAAALRAMEIGASALFKATKVPGVYDKDPKKHADATMFKALSYDQFLRDRIGVMDSTAISLCRDNKLPIRVFALAEPGAIRRALFGEDVGTVIDERG
ncbi:MAG: UMP kinase [Myxococcales bacterium]|nr:UMP kinase [Myxococcales bacterium]